MINAKLQPISTACRQAIQSALKLICLLCPLIILIGCFRTILEPQLKHQAQQVIHPSSARAISVALNLSRPQESLGYQYIFGPFPWSRIYLSEGNELAQDLFSQALLLKGWQPETASTIPQTQSLPKPRNSITINIEGISLNAYDLIFTRRIVCHINGRALLVIHNRAPLVLPFDFTESSYHLYAFQSQLERVLRRCLLGAADQIVAGPRT